jgi:FKBP-type peptidyl-prolyl cis-trans isomerase
MPTTSSTSWISGGLSPRGLPSRLLAGLVLLSAAGCAGAVGGTTPPIEETAFAPSLQVDLSAMERAGSGLYVRDTRAGTGDVVRRGSRVSVYFAGWMPDGTQVDARVEPEDPVEFTVGGGEVIRGWDEGVLGMREGGQRQLVIPARLAYGPRGRGPIPPSTHLVFVINLVEVR